MLDIHAVLDQRAVTPVFQPLADLTSGLIIGYEALSRGPAGTPWEAPMALFAAARAAGREPELDWICRAAAYRAALRAGFGAELNLFVNMEPTAWRVDCPADLVPVVEQARDRLRVVTEMTERVIADDPAALLAATGNCRENGWGVALDDVGADPMSLALMPFVHPDVVKLDMGLLRAPDHPATARVVAAVAAYAEASGAIVLAEGVETAEQMEVARTMGATLGQGWHLGRPGPLPGVLPIGAALPTLGRARPETRTPFEVVARQRRLTRTTKAQLMPMSRHLEALAGDGPEPPVLLACFQDARNFTAATVRRFTRIAAHSPLVAALGAGLPATPAPGVRGAHLGPGDPLRGEWSVLVIGPHRAAALVARDLGDLAPEPERRFDFALTHDRDLVVAAARTLLGRLTPITGPASTRNNPTSPGHLSGHASVDLAGHRQGVR
ncbi:Phytochrome-like protein cph2 [Actinoplanes sp. SE50]|uniref:sensor domain-containing phosphodiesterase n=1 Tax=unclassified Actinoplanes TaxID=2626549 RepID=UPI00023EC446|nr:MULTISPECIES: EAL domain-containing protein [unclassified Actinoplanes]AEV83614.1 Phytochrome-like protein cph2 [Actinoplanes sp. SE50/110]ATO82242.1 Phytochrome-like protein cph2 [Actinoplanes sp. SE50]SLL99649.1 Phytochrome-like protein cph2 [Actinoplanes sp. SE50/110]